MPNQQHSTAREALWGFMTNLSRPTRTEASDLRTMASEVLGNLHALDAFIPTGSDEHAQALNRVARARCAEWLDREHGMDLGFARELVDKILDIYADSTRTRR